MGEWSEAMEDGVICPHCFSVLVENGDNSGFSLRLRRSQRDKSSPFF
jgi:hypothetical protein